MNIIERLIKNRFKYFKCYERDFVVLRLRYNTFSYLITLDNFKRILDHLNNNPTDKFVFFEKGWICQDRKIKRVKQILIALDNILTANYETVVYFK